jgi:hypothetical protein
VGEESREREGRMNPCLGHSPCNDLKFHVMNKMSSDPTWPSRVAPMKSSSSSRSRSAFPRFTISLLRNTLSSALALPSPLQSLRLVFAAILRC